jgi:hypothetical protein
MKKLLLTIVLVAAAATGAFSQVKGLSVGAGYQTYTQHEEGTITLPIIGSTTLNDDYSFGGFYVGANYTVLTLGPGIALTPGLHFSYASFTDKNNTDNQRKESWIGIPVNFSYKFNLVPKTLSISPYLGPTFSIGLSKKETFDKWGNTTNLYSEDYKYGRFNIAIGGGIALDIVDMIRVTFGYNQYLLNTYTGDNDVKFKRNNAIHFGVAYIF